MTIQRLSKLNHSDVVEFFGDQMVNYHFIVNDLLMNQYQGKAFHVFGEYEDGMLVSMLLNNFDNITYFAMAERTIEPYLGMLNRLTFTKLSGPSDLIGKFIPYVEVKQDTISHMGVVREIFAARRYPELDIRLVKNADEIGMQYDLLKAGGFADSLPEDKEEYISNESQRIQQSSDRTAYLSVNGQMVSSAATVREGENSAIIIGVMTDPRYRNKGYGTEVLLGLFEMLLAEEKYPYLFYTNPAARSVYKKLGMTEVCEWRVIKVC